ncbi:thioredoxin family protein [Sinomicrobium soli]|uniref:thioredoxin family protein n=1 Tax=Sinomicrobium sp. N-1-3-6 TaxID=2219864 RepID=UPI000DCC4BDF|nr:thioredoxin family protein [Sinomicrobium sp. N-1-3-6]RAV29949.1 thioredoxin family protein [Sinomicrobium sp. N-1-3-6]
MKTNFFLLALLTLMHSFAASPSYDDIGYKVGDLAEDFSLKSTEGKTVSLSDYKEARGYLVIFTCNTCPYARAYEDRIIALDRKYRSQGVPVIAINPNNPEKSEGDGFEQMKQRASEKGFTFPYLLDEGQKISPKYGASRTPHVFLLEKTGQGNRVRYIGAIDDNYQNAALVETPYAEEAVNAMLEGREISITTTKAIGCSIKR